MTITLTNDDIPATMRRIRMELGLTQAQIADRIGITASALTRWERGYNSYGPSIPPIDKLQWWANALDCNITITLTPKGQP